MQHHGTVGLESEAPPGSPASRGVFVEYRTRTKHFFFEKKKQKTFVC
jgi:hypothetical protein